MEYEDGGVEGWVPQQGVERGRGCEEVRPVTVSIKARHEWGIEWCSTSVDLVADLYSTIN